jgi:predicted amidophosphoribosyltransferase
MPKRLTFFPAESIHPPQPGFRCPQCGYQALGSGPVCQPCAEQREPTRCEQAETAQPWWRKRIRLKHTEQPRRTAGAIKREMPPCP